MTAGLLIKKEPAPCLPATGPGLARSLVPVLTLAVLLWGTSPGRAGAETLQEAYGRALKDHYEGRYARAIDAFERILAVPMEHEDLHYNLGCAYYRLGKLGPAIFHFERALALDPSAEDARFNLEASRALAASRVTDELRGAASEPMWVRAAGLLGTRSWTILFLALWWLTFAVLLVVRRVPSGPLRAGLVAGNSFIAMLAVSCGLLFLLRVYEDHRVSYGIVLPDRMEVREGPSASARSTFKLHAGFRVRLQSRNEGWVRIRLANGLEGWVVQKDIGVL